MRTPIDHPDRADSAPPLGKLKGSVVKAGESQLPGFRDALRRLKFRALLRVSRWLGAIECRAEGHVESAEDACWDAFGNYCCWMVCARCGNERLLRRTWSQRASEEPN